ncbi:protein of unknown function [Pseudomonas mediterranea]
MSFPFFKPDSHESLELELFGQDKFFSGGWSDAIASRLAPTGIRGGRDFCGHSEPVWERACSR